MTDPVKAKIQELCPDIMGTHVFEVGYNVCKFCNEPRIIRDRKRDVIAVDEKSGGSVSEVTETSYDQTEFPCSKNPRRSPSLADVLRAIGAENFTTPRIGELLARWNLLKDYDGQTEETKKFIGSLLGV